MMADNKESEVTNLRKAILAANGGSMIPLTVLATTKMHGMRVMPKNVQQHQSPPDQNVQPGAVLDRHVVHPRLNEFYLNAHRTLQVGF